MKRFGFILLLILLITNLSGCNVLEMIPKSAAPTLPPTIVVPPLETNTPRPTIVIHTSTPTIPAVTNQPQTSNQEPEADPVWKINEADRTVLRIDPIGHIVTGKVQIGGWPIALAEGNQFVWVIEAIDDTRCNILKIDTNINQIISSIPITHGKGTSLIVSDDSVWVGIAEPVNLDLVAEDTEYMQPGGIVRIDPFANQVAEYIEAEGVVGDLLLEGTDLWTLNYKITYTYFERIDLIERIISTIPASVESSEYLHEFARMDKNSLGLWGTPLASGAKAIFRINPDTGKIESTIDIEAEADDMPVDLVAEEDFIWVAMLNGRVIKIDAVTEELLESYDLGGSNFTEISLEEGSIWVSSYKEAMVYQLDILTGTVIGAISTGNKPQPSPTPTLSPTPDPRAAWNACEGTYQSYLSVGRYAKVSEEPPLPNRVRIEPNKDSDILGYIQPGEIVEIIAGPDCTDGWVWWNVRSISTGLTGWTSEGDGGDYWLLPTE